MLGTWADVIANRRELRRLLLVTQSALLLVAALPAALTGAIRAVGNSALRPQR